MARPVRIASISAVSVLSVLLLAACGASPGGSPTGGVVTPVPAGIATPAPTITPTPTPTPTPLPTHVGPAVATASLVVHADGIALVGENGSEITRILYTSDPAAAAAQLGAAIGLEPQLRNQSGDCGGGSQVWSWGTDMRLEIYSVYPRDHPGARWEVDVSAAETPNGLPIGAGPTAVRLGADIAQVSAIPGVIVAPAQGDQRGPSALIEPQDGGTWGIQAWLFPQGTSTDPTITVMLAPITWNPYVGGNC